MSPRSLFLLVLASCDVPPAPPPAPTAPISVPVQVPNPPAPRLRRKPYHGIRPEILTLCEPR